MQILDPLKQYAIQLATMSTASITIPVTSYNYNITFVDVVLTSRASTEFLPFTVTNSTSAPPKLNICTLVGPTNRLCLDQDGTNKTRSVLQPYGAFTGQQWTLNGTVQPDGATVWSLRSEFAGPDLYLAGQGSSVAMSANAPASATCWKFVEVSSANSSMTAVPPVVATTVNAPGSTSLVTSASTSASRSASTSVASKALVGSVLAVVVGGLAICTALLF